MWGLRMTHEITCHPVYPLNHSSVAMPVPLPGPTVKHYDRGKLLRKLSHLVFARRPVVSSDNLSPPSSVKCRGQYSDSGRRKLPVHWCLNDLTDAASRPTRSDPRRWISLHYALATRRWDKSALVRRVLRSIQQFPLEEDFRFAGASTTQLISFREIYSAWSQAMDLAYPYQQDVEFGPAIPVGG